VFLNIVELKLKIIQIFLKNRLSIKT